MICQVVSCTKGKAGGKAAERLSIPFNLIGGGTEPLEVHRLTWECSRIRHLLWVEPFHEFRGVKFLVNVYRVVIMLMDTHPKEPVQFPEVFGDKPSFATELIDEFIQIDVLMG
jgi:hypothetical protein